MAISGLAGLGTFGAVKCLRLCLFCLDANAVAVPVPAITAQRVNQTVQIGDSATLPVEPNDYPRAFLSQHARTLIQ